MMFSPSIFRVCNYYMFRNNGKTIILHNFSTV